ncbi:hypothetical protein GmHk_19G054404 [Glycine max]|nr:hypothetical protein GmHk_19G054404 [Glycine max]
MVEEFEEILGCPLGGRKPYLFSGFYPSLARISKIVQISAQELDHRKQVKNGVVGIPRKCLEAKARILAGKGEWAPLIDILALLIFRGVFFPNVDGLVDLAAIDIFLAYHNHKESPVVTMLADLYDTFDRRCEKSNTRIVCCTPALYVWLVSHFFRQEQAKKEHLPTGSLDGRKEEPEFFSCGGFPSVPLMGTRGCISYNPILAIRQLLYPMRRAPLAEELAPVISRGFNKTNMETLQKVRKAWEVVQKKDKELRGSNNGPIGGYRKWLKAHVQGLDWLPSLRAAKREEVKTPEEDEEVQVLRAELEQAQTVKERFKSAALKIRKENAELRDINIATTKALEQETKRAHREEHGRNKFRGALWGSNSELKLRREERDQSRVDSLILKDELKVCSKSKRSLSQRLCETETNMLAIITKYQEELNLAAAHEHRVADKYAQVYAEKEARRRVIDSLHQEATMWMDRFALTLNRSQELPRLLAKAKAMADTYSAPEEIHRLLSYCQHMIDLMTHIIRNR